MRKIERQLKTRQRQWFICVFLCALIILFVGISLTQKANAENLVSDARCYSILSSGGLGFGHAGFMFKADFYSNSGIEQTNAVSHVNSYSNPVNHGTRSTFLNGNSFLGYYAPKAQMSNATRDGVRATMVMLKYLSDCNEITYRASGQIDYHGSTVRLFPGYTASVSVIEPENITRLRCDGYVEYCYEYNNVRISGTNSTWNIAIDDENTQNWHNQILTGLSPKIQAYTYMNSMVGDVNADGIISSSDARTALRISALLDEPTDYQLFVADVSGDGYILATDARVILQHSAGLHTGDFDKTILIKTNNPNNANSYSNAILSALRSGALNWLI